MLIKKLYVLAIGLTTCLSASVLANSTPSKIAPQGNNIPYNFHGEIDKTDIYAIPLDSSEEEQEDELDELEQESKKHSK